MFFQVVVALCFFKILLSEGFLVFQEISAFTVNLTEGQFVESEGFAIVFSSSWPSLKKTVDRNERVFLFPPFQRSLVS